MKIIESPRDEIQGIHDFIPTDKKINYINSLLKIGFDTIDFGSFVSPKAIPQMSDTEDVVKNLSSSETNLSVIIPNLRGVESAIKYSNIKYLGFLFSISETFLQKNVNSTIGKTIENFFSVKKVSDQHNKEIIVNFSMSFGNPYGDEYELKIIDDYVNFFKNNGIKIITLADTIGISTKENIYTTFEYLIKNYPEVEFGFHLHSEKNQWYDRISSAYDAGVRRYESVLGGLGGCPAALTNGKLINNLQTINLINFCKEKNIEHNLDLDKFEESVKIFKDLF